MGRILLSTLLMFFSVSAAAQTVSQRMSVEDYKNAVLSVLESGNYYRSGAQRPFGPAQLQLLKLAIYDHPADADFVRVIDASYSQPAQALVDQAALKIFSSPLFANSFCNFVPDQNAASWNFGVSAEASSAIFNRCNEALKNRSNSQRLLLKSGRKVVFIQTKEPAPVQSWTSMNGDLQIFHEGSLSEFELVRALAHEYYVAFDHLWMFSSMSANHFLDGTGFTTRDPSLTPRYFDSFFLPLIRGSFQMARAFRFEEDVLKELYPGASEPAQRTDCWSTIKALATQLEFKQQYFLSASFFFMPGTDRLAISKQGLTPVAIDMMRELELKVGANHSLCAFMSTPQVSMSSTFFNSGPRPRIGGGTERTNKNETDNQTSATQKAADAINAKKNESKAADSPNAAYTSLEILSKQWPMSFKTKQTAPTTIKIDLSTLHEALEDDRK